MNRNHSIRQALVAVVAITASLLATAQNSFNLPYSQYGVGDIVSEYRSPLGEGLYGTVLSTRGNNMVNPYNPASYGTVEIESFVFDVGLTMQHYRLSNATNNLNDFDGNISHLAVAFPITRWWKSSAGLLPFSNMGFKSIDTTVTSEGKVRTIYEGNGETYRIYWGNAFNIAKNWTLGFNLNYVYGDVSRAECYDFLASDNYVDSRRLKSVQLSMLYFDLGTQVVLNLDDKRELTLAATYTLPRKSVTIDTAWIYSMNYESGTAYSIIDSAAYESNVELGGKVGIGARYVYDNLWSLSLDMSYSPWHGVKYTDALPNPILTQDYLRHDNNLSVAVGAAWLGDKEASSYWQRIAIHAGAHYNYGQYNLALPQGETRVDEWGAGVGFDFPMRKGRSKVSLSIGYSSYGSKDVLRTEATTIGISLSSCERWFTKKQYN